MKIHRADDLTQVEGTTSIPANWLLSCVEEMSHSGFQGFCRALLEAEGVNITDVEVRLPGDVRRIVDAVGDVSFREPSGLVRVEKWGFEFRLYKDGRVSVGHLHEVLSRLKASPMLDMMCFMTSGRSTSLAEEVVNSNPQLRLWDYDVLETITRKNTHILEKYCGPVGQTQAPTGPHAAQLGSSGSGDLIAPHPTVEGAGTFTLPSVVFKGRLDTVPPGQAAYASYEHAVNDIINYIFAGKVGEPRPQSTTIDGAQRRDTLYKNKQEGPFWRRIAHRFEADFIIVDAKNYAKPIRPGVIQDVEKYANKAIGKFILVVSRRGPDENVERAQLRTWRDRGVMILVISDEQLLEMVCRKEKGLVPEDLLDDALDELLIKF